VTLAMSRESLARLPLAERFDIGAVEHKRVEAGPTLNRVAAIAGIPDEGIIAGPADDGVVAGAAIEGQRHRAGDHRRGIDRVVAGAAVDDELIGSLLVGDDDAGGGADDPDAAV